MQSTADAHTGYRPGAPPGLTAALNMNASRGGGGAPGAGREVTHLLLQNLPKEADRYGVSAGAKIYSSGVGNSETKGIFPPGLLLGYVKEFEVRDFDAVARVQPAPLLHRGEHVNDLLAAADKAGAAKVRLSAFFFLI